MSIINIVIYFLVEATCMCVYIVKLPPDTLPPWRKFGWRQCDLRPLDLAREYSSFLFLLHCMGVKYSVLKLAWSDEYMLETIKACTRCRLLAVVFSSKTIEHETRHLEYLALFGQYIFETMKESMNHEGLHKMHTLAVVFSSQTRTHQISYLESTRP